MMMMVTKHPITYTFYMFMVHHVIEVWDEVCEFMSPRNNSKHGGRWGGVSAILICPSCCHWELLSDNKMK